MNQPPKFSILLPAKGRPTLVRDALQSLISQNFDNFEIIVSNNGADKNVKQAILDLLEDKRVIYIEQLKVLPMPEHWEHLSLLANGEYLMVLTDRSVLKQNALKTLYDIHSKDNNSNKVISWPWDIYYSDSNMLMEHMNLECENVILNSEALMVESMTLNCPYPMALPRGLNSSVSMEIVRKIRQKAGAVFLPINPDFSFAYNCLFEQKKITHLTCSLMISQGLAVSNGGNAYLTDASVYVSTLGLNRPIKYSPIKSLFVENVIAEDFFSACHLYERLDLINRFDMKFLYQKCLNELQEKKFARLLPKEHILLLEESINQAIREDNAQVQLFFNEIKQKFSGFLFLRGLIKRLVNTKLKFIKPYLLRLRGARKVISILDAAGHSSL